MGTSGSQPVTTCDKVHFQVFSLSPALFIRISTFQLVYLPPCGEICPKLSRHGTSTNPIVQEIISYCRLLDPAHIIPIISQVSFGAFGR